jgi:hypothetical protein
MMKFGRALVLINAVIFIIYGCFYLLYPIEASMYVTQSIPATTTAVIDMRAVYGGMSIAIGIILVLLSINNHTLLLAVKILFIYMLCMAFARFLGVIVDGNANNKMYYYLIAEGITAMICLIWLIVVKSTSSLEPNS